MTARTVFLCGGRGRGQRSGAHTIVSCDATSCPAAEVVGSTEEIRALVAAGWRASADRKKHGCPAHARLVDPNPEGASR